MTRLRRLVASLALALAAAVGVPAAPPLPSASVAQATLPFSWRDDALSGPGADRLRAAVASAQFVLVGEEHNDRDTPLFTCALYALLHREDGFDHLVVEQDPLGVELALSAGRRGNAAAIGKALAASPSLLGFASDQDLALLAAAGRAGGIDAIWGLEQAQAPITYLQQLAPLAPPGAIRGEVHRLLVRARAEEAHGRADFAQFLAYDRATQGDLIGLLRRWEPPAGSRARRLLDGLVKSAEIYGYYIRAHAEHDPAFTYLNGTVREAWLKAGFVAAYRPAAACGGPLPRALFKFGDNHVRRGVGSTGAWTLGTFASELAAFDSASAYGILVVPIGTAISDWSHLPDELKPLLPASRPPGPVLVDLTALRPRAQAVVATAPAAVREQVRAMLFGFDGIVVLPDSAPATWRLTGFGPL